MKSITTSTPSRAEPRTARLANGGVRITKPGRKLSAAERAVVEERLRNEGILPRTNERI
jgi:hypothetical protein